MKPEFVSDRKLYSGCGSTGSSCFTFAYVS